MSELNEKYIGHLMTMANLAHIRVKKPHYIYGTTTLWLIWVIWAYNVQLPVFITCFTIVCLVVICFGGFVNIRGGINVSPICG